ncbi:acyltransferase family protein [Taibaiella koreensis]|uniref:acyltransferase family protein n=1 Tax=Taibaiella koreensis TaxID=1268548 RepID=UPI000E59BDED|nr:acyltransferase [Taibaiella koreensis]
MESRLPQRFYGLDHLRALAIVMVLLFHYRAFSHPAWVDTVGQWGWMGVDLFFVLSGWLIAGQLFRQLKYSGTIAKKDFFLKRLFRILPPYLVVVGLYFLVPAFREREALAPLWKFLSFTQNFGLDVIHKGTFSHAWSLCIEEQFYLTLPFCLLFLNKVKAIRFVPGIAFFLLLLVMLLRYLSWNVFVRPDLDSDRFWLTWYRWIYYPTYTRLDGIVLGVMLAFLYVYKEPLLSRLSRYGNFFLLAGIVVLAAAFRLCLDPYTFTASIAGFSAVALGFGCLVLAAVSPSTFLFRYRSWITAQLASLSYSVYLTHKGVIHLVQNFLDQVGMDPGSNFSLLLCLLCCLAAGVLFRYMIEKPAVWLRDKWIGLLNA